MKLDTTEAITEDTSSDRNSVKNDEDLPLGQAIRRYPRVAGYCLALTTAILLWGYDLVVVGSITAVPAFQRDFGELFNGDYIFPATWLSLWLSFGPLGSTLGSVTGGWLQDRIGRRHSLMIGSIISAIAVVIIFVANTPSNVEARRGVFLLGKTIQGFSIGVIKIQALTYVSENAPTSLRGPMMALFPTFTLMGQLIGSAVVFSIEGHETSKGYVAAFGSQWALSAAPLILSFVLPESPAYLVRRGQMDKALDAAKRLFEPRVSATAALEKIAFNVENEKAMSREVTFMDCFNAAHRRRTGIILFVNILPALFGLGLLSSASYFLQTVGMDSKASLMFLISGIVLGLLANGASIWVLSRVGRRKLTCITIAIACLLWGSMGISGFWSTPPAILYAAISMNIIIVVCGIGCWPAGYAIMGETSALRLRSKSQAVGGVGAQISSILMSFILPYIFNPDAGNLKAKTGFVFAGLSAIAVIVSWIYIPEMKGRSVGEIDEMFRLGLPARDFKKWRGNVDQRGVVTEEKDGSEV
ncbi:hypothetical protein DL766_009082 [Monosporascus sp. MC13-8B]|uniref:Major facilitator superfamily (MFS) profile domain-containing protein n=1 Tax=Monosporascus cannonballus TaxID=155416 RepID=A0ABY0H7M8_9PEZI|nr:hypothetical protein DL763_009102 [Monosporascus cannonballus]RYO86989.1 hypothetical protein DL762_004414 [Monosporascus cannonballus]RYP16653.1 hypothetical protein DL766_009082 [Monosporascus sp. MC13-8B]